MNEKTETNPRGSGIGKSTNRIEMEKIDLIKLMNTQNTNFICGKYGVSKNTFYQVLTEQFAKRNIGNKPDEIKIHTMPNIVENLKKKGAWMGSDARAYMVENDLMEKKKLIS